MQMEKKLYCLVLHLTLTTNAYFKIYNIWHLHIQVVAIFSSKVILHIVMNFICGFNINGILNKFINIIWKWRKNTCVYFFFSFRLQYFNYLIDMENGYKLLFPLFIHSIANFFLLTVYVNSFILYLFKGIISN